MIVFSRSSQPFCAAAVIIGVARWLGRSGIQTGPEVYGCAQSATCEDE